MKYSKGVNNNNNNNSNNNNEYNKVLTYISTNDITELNDLIYAGAKLVCKKIGIPS